LVGLLAAMTLAGAHHAELLGKEIKELSIEEQVEFLKRLRGPWSAYLTRRMEVEGDLWPAVDDLFGPVSRLSAKEQKRIADATRAILRKRLLEPLGGYARAYDKVDKSIRVNRILNRGLFEGSDLPRGGGAYFSFTERSNDYNDSVHLGMELWQFRSGFAGGDVGVVVEVPAKGIREVSAKDTPAKLRLAANKFEAHCRVAATQPRAAPGQLYIVRAVRWDEHDIVVAFEVLQKDRYGVTFAWKILNRQPAPKRSRR
jgi:hypothetical protein